MAIIMRKNRTWVTSSRSRKSLRTAYCCLSLVLICVLSRWVVFMMKKCQHRQARDKDFDFLFFLPLFITYLFFSFSNCILLFFLVHLSLLALFGLHERECLYWLMFVSQPGCVAAHSKNLNTGFSQSVWNQVLLHDDNLHSVLHFHTSFVDLGLILTSQRCQKGKTAQLHFVVQCLFDQV